MKPYFENERMTLYHGDVMDALRAMPAESVHCVVTSPPYWGLRSYGVDGQIGLEQSPAEFVDKMVQVFREVKRVLRKDGTVWCNLGDSYVAGPTGHQDISNANGKAADMFAKGGRYRLDNMRKDTGRHFGVLKPKDLCMIPARVALALQDDGWWLRSEITWCKRAPMPESVTDRPTSATEKIYLLAKGERYFYDADAVREGGVVQTAEERVKRNGSKPHRQEGIAGQDGRRALGLNNTTFNPAGRNLWNYWLLSPESFSEAHFATFVTEIPRRAISAGTSERGCCAECGAPWRRVIEKSTHFEGGSGKAGRTAEEVNASGKWAGKQYGDNLKLGPVVTVETKGWQPTCKHDAPVVPCTVLDPFGGALTTPLVALRLGRRAVGIDLNSDYLDMGIKRIERDTQANQMHLDLTA